jgi:YebC/PmpR family DNA-binding regulatory protein
VALLIDVLTDNRNRTSGDVRAIFSKFGGAMTEPGAVGWQFSRRGLIMVDGRAAEDDVMAAAIEAGAEDVALDGDAWRVTSEPSVVFEVKAALEAAGLTVLSAESTMVSSNLVPVEDLDDARKVLRIMDALEDNDDVQDVYSNFDMSDDTMAAASA